MQKGDFRNQLTCSRKTQPRVGKSAWRLTRPEKLCRRRLEISACDPPRKTLPQEVGNFGLRGSISARLAGTIAVNVTQVMVSSKWLETDA